MQPHMSGRRTRLLFWGMAIGLVTALFATAGAAQTRPLSVFLPLISRQPALGASLSAGYEHVCQRTDTRLTCWGDDTYGQASPPAEPFTQVSTGARHTCGMTPAGQVICWGDNTMGQTTTPPDTFTQISAGTWHTCGVTTRGQVVCWGSDEYAQTAAPAGTFTQVSAGIWHTCALQPDGLPVCWGDNEFGQATPPPTPLTQLRAGGRHTCGLQATGQAVCWGGNTYGQSTPPTTAFAQLSAGGRHTCGKQADGQVVCWGLDDYGQATPPTEAFTTVQAGSRYTCGLTAGNQVICWGDVRWVGDTCVAESASPRDIGSAPRCFDETGFCIDGRIRDYWEQNGGLPVFGFPISVQRTFPIEGQPIEAQWFERNRLELHPENAPPYDVLLGRLGVDVLAQQGRDWQAFPRDEAAQPGCRYFAEPGRRCAGYPLRV